MPYRFVRLEFLDSLFVSVDVLRVDFVLGSCGVETAEFEKNLYGPLVLRGGQPLRALPLKLDRFFCISYS
jgi:hypothetical protein